MEEEKQKGGKYLIITLLLVIIVILGAILTIIATTDDSNTNNDKNVKEVEKKKKEEEEEQEAIRSKKTFLSVISSLKYLDEKDFYKNDVAEVERNDSTDIYNANTTKKIYTTDEYGYEWYGSFGIFYDDEDSIIVNDEGKTLFITDGELDYYPATKIWQFNENIYNSDGLLEKDAMVIDDYGNYILTEKKDMMVLEDSKKKEIYSVELVKDESAEYGYVNSIFDEQYAILSTSEYDYIVNVKNGKEICKEKYGSIEYLEDNIFEIGKDTYFVKDDKLAIKIAGVNHSTEVSSRYVAFDNDVYDVKTLNKVDTNTFIPDYETALVEKLTGLELTECRTGYGLKYKGEEILECKYEDISLYDYNITRALMSSNKLYVVISSDDYSYEIYDVYNKKIALYNIDDYDYTSPFVTLYEDDNIYIYNIIDGSKTPNDNGDDVYLYDNYYVLTTNKADTYYNKEFKKIAEVKNED